jgi:molecular chaperone IbpA
MVSKQIFDTLSLPQILNYTIGFDRTFDRLESNLLDGHNRYGQINIKYPPYDIKKVGDTNYVINLALAGFGKDDIVIQSAQLTDGLLSIELEQLVPEEKRPRTIEIK